MKVKLSALWGGEGKVQAGLGSELPVAVIPQQVQEDKMGEPFQREAGPGGGGQQLTQEGKLSSQEVQK